MDKILNFQASLFGNFVDIKPDAKTILKLLTKLQDEDFIPGSFEVNKVDIQTGKLTTESRLQIISTDKSKSIVFLEERIDFNYNYNENASVYKSIEKLCDLVKPFITKVFSEFSDMRGNRLALNCRILMDEMTDEEFDVFYKRFTIPLKIYSNEALEEWSIRYNHYESMPVLGDDIKEKCNRIISMERNVVNSVISPKRVIAILDVNTLPENKELRFNHNNLLPFMDAAKNFIEEAIKEIEGV